MRPNLLNLIHCPACNARLAAEVASEDEIEWISGRLICEGCGRQYPLENGMAYLYLEDEHWASKAREAAGWVQIHKNQGIYDHDGRVDQQIPYFPEEPWIRVAKSFDLARDWLDLDGSEAILDLGAGRGWAAKHFALNGHEVVAVDVVPDPLVGLGRSRALMDSAGTYFERVIADGENLPFDNNMFDVVFCAAALHHFSDLTILFRNISAVLKPGGRLCAINEPCINVATREAQVLRQGACEEVNLGINETRPNVIQYIAALEAAGLEVSEVSLIGTVGLREEQLTAWKKQNGAQMPSLSLEHPLRTSRAFGHYFLKRLLALRNGELETANELSLRAKDMGLDVDGLLWLGGEMFLVATKPSTLAPQRRILE